MKNKNDYFKNTIMKSLINPGKSLKEKMVVEKKVTPVAKKAKGGKMEGCGKQMKATMQALKTHAKKGKDAHPDKDVSKYAKGGKAAMKSAGMSLNGQDKKKVMPIDPVDKFAAGGAAKIRKGVASKSGKANKNAR